MTSSVLVCFVSIFGALVLAAERDVTTEELRCHLLEWHNRARDSEPADDMPMLTWANSLSEKANDWTSGCYYSHQMDEVFGENLAAITYRDGDNVTSLVYEMFQGWMDEKEYNVNGTFEECCGPLHGHCCHYTQVIWARTTQVGCSVSLCDPLATAFDDSARRALFIACYYNPGGNTPFVDCNYDWRPFLPSPP